MITYNRVYGDRVKIKYCDDLLIIYLYNVKLNLSENVELVKSIKDILVKIMNNNEISFGGIYKVVIYENKYYGYIIEINKIKEFEYSDFIDLKIEIRLDQTFYLITNNYYYLENINNVYFYNNQYYVNICEFKNVNFIFEYGNIIYNKYENMISKSVKIK